MEYTISQWLLLEMSDQTWHIPLDNLHMILRVGDSIRFAAGESGVVTEVEYELALRRRASNWEGNMPANVSYARRIRVVIKV
jgi:hypothetical protein